MKISVVVKTNARRNSVEKISEQEYRVFVNAPPVEGKANEAVIRLLSDFFSVPKSSIRLLHGHHGKKKLFELQESSSNPILL